MPLLVEADAAAAAVLREPLAEFDVEVVPTTDELAVRLLRRSQHAVVLGPSLDLVAALTTADAVRTQHPATSVILTRSTLSPEIYAWAMDSGVSAVVEAGDHEALTTAVLRARQTWRAIHGGAEPVSRAAGRVVTVFSPKGGVGKTTMSVNIALALAATGSRVCLIDLDLAFGDVAITLQLIPTNTLADAVGMEERLDWTLLRGLLAEHRSGLQVLAAPTNPEGRERITPSLVRRVISELRDRFDHIVVDTPPGFDDQVLGAFDETDEIVIVATLDVPTIKNVRVAIETLDLLDLVPGHRHLVLNRADQEVGLTATNVEDLLGVPVDVTLPSAIAVACATNNGDPIVASSPQHAVSLALADFVRRLPGVASLPGAAPADDAAPRRGGLFSRRRKDLVR